MYVHMYISVYLHVSITHLCVYVCCYPIAQLAPSLEILFMLFFTTDLVLRLQWRPFFYLHPRTLFKVHTCIRM